LLFHPRRSGPARHLAVALAILLALHGFAAGAIGTLGRLHTHQPAATLVVLDDVRRGVAAELRRDDGAAGRHGHAHAAGAALRHHHAVGDASVTWTRGDPLHALDADDAPAGTALAAFVALVPESVDGLMPGPDERRATAPAWVPRTHHPEPLERPPRFA
jgi:hypothetical protein